MKVVQILRAEHFSVPGLIYRAFSTYEKAEAEAIEIVAGMMKDNGEDWQSDVESWEHAIARLQEQHGAQYCYVEIMELEIDS